MTHWKRLWCWEGLGAGGEGDDRGWDGWMASLTRWTWIWVNSRSWWWTGRPGLLQFMGSQRVGHDWANDLIWSDTVKGFGIVNKAEIDVFLEFSCFFDDPADVGILISSSSAFSKTSFYIWKFAELFYCWSLAWRILSITLLACAAAAAAKSLQSCPTLWDPIDGSQPGSPVPGVLQARTVEWVAISFSNTWKWKVKVKSPSRVRLFAIPCSPPASSAHGIFQARVLEWDAIALWTTKAKLVYLSIKH